MKEGELYPVYPYHTMKWYRDFNAEKWYKEVTPVGWIEDELDLNELADRGLTVFSRVRIP